MWPVAWELQELQDKLKYSGLLGTECTAEDHWRQSSLDSPGCQHCRSLLWGMPMEEGIRKLAVNEPDFSLEIFLNPAGKLEEFVMVEHLKCC